MQRYRAEVNVLGLHPGQEFSSDHEYYIPLAINGFLTEIEEGVDDAGSGEQPSSIEGAGDGSGSEGAGEGVSVS